MLKDVKKIPVPFFYPETTQAMGGKENQKPLINQKDIDNNSKEINPKKRKINIEQKEQLKLHKQYLENTSTAKTKVGFFSQRTPKSPPKENKYCVIPIDTKNIDVEKFFKDVQHDDLSRPGKLTPKKEHVETPGGSILTKFLDLGVFVVYSDKNSTIEHKKIDPNTILEDRVVVTPPRTGKKVQTLQFDSEEEEKCKRSECLSQHEVMRREGVPVGHASATQIGLRAGIISEEERCEWLHLICFMLLRKRAQSEDNLVIGTFHANTTMIPVEEHLPNLKKYFGKNITLSVSADLIQGTHIVKRMINYVIKIEQPEGLPPIEIKFEFDALQKTASTRRVKKFIDIFMQCVYDKAAKDSDKLLKEMTTEELETTVTALGKEEINKRSNETPVSEKLSDDIFDIEPLKLNFENSIVPLIVNTQPKHCGRDF